MKARTCTDYTYFNIGISFGDIIGALVLTINLGFWSIELVLIESKIDKGLVSSKDRA